MSNPFEQESVSGFNIDRPQTVDDAVSSFDAPANGGGDTGTGHGIEQRTDSDNDWLDESKDKLIDPAANHAQSKTVKLRDNKTSLDAVAKLLIDEQLLLTALELHTELLEGGRSVKRLNDYFTNPGNFEHTNSLPPQTFGLSMGLLARSSSAQTFDSLDFTPGSEADLDQRTDDRVAVLEFELRKANETIRSLRQQLTQASHTDNSQGPSLELNQGEDKHQFNQSQHRISSISEHSAQSPALMHERRALNYLVHEYLLQSNYKMSSITFADEATDQDFEDWDDVGLNVPRPSDLLVLYRQFGYSNRHNQPTNEQTTMCNLDVELNPYLDGFTMDPTDMMNKLNTENNSLLTRNNELTEEIESVKAELNRLHLQLQDVQARSNTNTNNWNNANPTQPINKETPTLQSVEPIKRNRTINASYVSATQSVIGQQYAQAHYTLMQQIDGSLDKPELSVHLLAELLPSILPNIMLNKRSSAVPLVLLCSILLEQVNEQESKEPVLLCELFHLIKRPDDEQRHLLVAALTYFAAHVGATRVETQLLPLCWEQMNNKHEERRILVADTCGAIAAYVPPSLLSSLVLSMLQQMLVDDKSARVREAVLRALASLALFVEDTQKLNTLNELCERALHDVNEAVICTAQRVFLPALAMWTLDMGVLYTAVIDKYLDKFTQIIQMAGCNQRAQESTLSVYVGCLRALTPVLFWSVLSTAQLADDTDNTHLGDVKADRLPIDPGICSVRDFADDEKSFDELLLRFDVHTSQEWYKSWPELDYVARQFIPRFVRVVSELDVSVCVLIGDVIDYVILLCRTLGRGFTNSKIKPLFTPFLVNKQNDVQDASSINHNHIDTDKASSSSVPSTSVDLTHAILPVYCASLLTAFQQESDWIETRQLLRSKLVEMSDHNAQPLVCTFIQLFRRQPSRQDGLLLVLYELCAHDTTSCRQLVAVLLCALVPPPTSLDAVRRRLVPALVSLSSDNQSAVRSNTCAGLLAVVTRAPEDTQLVEKVRMQLSTLFGDDELSVCAELVRCAANAAPNLHATFRDNFVLPELCTLAQRTATAHNHNVNERKALAQALFEAYSALSCCYLSPTAVGSWLVPGMRHLLVTLDPEHVKIAQSILKDCEAKLDQAAAALPPSNNALPSIGAGDQPSVSLSESVQGRSAGEAGDEMKSRMFGAFSHIRDKVDQHSSQVPGLFRKKN